MAALALIRRELITSLRSTRVVVFLSVLLASATFWVMMNWPDAASTQFVYLRSYANRLMENVGIAQLFAGLLLLPGIAGVAVTAEREQGTYELLRTTLIRPWAMVAAKAINALGIYVLLIISGMPILGVIFFLVGVEWSTLLMMNGVIVCTALAVVSTSVFCSIRWKRTVTSAVASYVAMLCCMGIPIVVATLTMELLYWSFLPPVNSLSPLSKAADFSRWLLEYLPGYLENNGNYLSSDSALEKGITLFSPAVLLTFNSRDLARWTVPAYCCGWQLLIAFTFFVKSARRLKREQFDTASAKPRRKRIHPVVLPRRFPYYLVDPEKPLAPLDETGNPMLRKELRWGMLGRATTLVRIFYGALFVSMLLFSGAGLVSFDPASLLTMGMGLCALAACVAGPALLASVLTKEYAESNFDMLRMTLLPPRKVFLGKLFGGMVNFVPLLLPGALVGLFAAGLYALDGPEFWPFLAYGVCLIALLVIALVCVACAMVAAFLARQASTAFLTSYVLVAVALGGFWLGAMGAADVLFPSPYAVFRNLAGLTSAQEGMLERNRLAQTVAKAASPLASTEALTGKIKRGNAGIALAVWMGSMLGFCTLSLVMLRFARRQLIAKFKAS